MCVGRCMHVPPAQRGTVGEMLSFPNPLDPLVSQSVSVGLCFVKAFFSSPPIDQPNRPERVNVLRFGRLLGCFSCFQFPFSRWILPWWVSCSKVGQRSSNRGILLWRILFAPDTVAVETREWKLWTKRKRITSHHILLFRCALAFWWFECVVFGGRSKWKAVLAVFDLFDLTFALGTEC